MRDLLREVSAGATSPHRITALGAEPVELPRCALITGGACRTHERSRVQALLLLAHTMELSQGTSGHTKRVRAQALRLARAIGVPAGEQAELGLAALLHDIGKALIPEQILRKPGPLTDDERLVVRQHPVHGAAIVAALPGMLRLSGAVRHHHERWDGAGYPDSLAGHAIPLAARIIAVADVWDALMHDRPYRTAFGETDARTILVAGRGTHFDADLVDCFLAII